MSDEENPATETSSEKSSVESKKLAMKPRKKFIPKKKVFKTDKPLEHRTRHIRLASLQAAQLVRQIRRQLASYAFIMKKNSEQPT